MKVTFYISSQDYSKFLSGKEVDMKTGDGWAGYIKIKAKHTDVQFIGERTVKRINIPTGIQSTGPK